MCTHIWKLLCRTSSLGSKVCYHAHPCVFCVYICVYMCAYTYIYTYTHMYSKPICTQVLRPSSLIYENHSSSSRRGAAGGLGRAVLARPGSLTCGSKYHHQLLLGHGVQGPRSGTPRGLGRQSWRRAGSLPGSVRSLNRFREAVGINAPGPQTTTHSTPGTKALRRKGRRKGFGGILRPAAKTTIEGEGISPVQAASPDSSLLISYQ